MWFLFRACGALVAVVLAALATVYFLSEEEFRQVPEVTPFVYSPSGDSTEVSRGRYVARTRGCFGCHGQSLEGAEFEEWDWVARGVAPNLSVLAKKYDYPTLEAAIRQGVGVDGRALFSMPSYNWVHLSDEDTGALITFLKSVPEVDDDLTKPKIGWSARLAILRGDEVLMHELSAMMPPLDNLDEDPVLARGQYLAMTMCNECHGFDLRGERDGPYSTPDLALVSAYNWEDFVTLTTEGVPLDGRDLGLMTMIARDRFPALTKDDRQALYQFLQTLSEKPIPQDVPWRTD